MVSASTGMNYLQLLVVDFTVGYQEVFVTCLCNGLNDHVLVDPFETVLRVIQAETIIFLNVLVTMQQVRFNRVREEHLTEIFGKACRQYMLAVIIVVAKHYSFAWDDLQQ